MSRVARPVGGDVNGFLGLVVDNLSVLALVAAVLVGGYGMPSDVVFGRMFPGTTLGVLLGDAFYTLLALRLARRSGRSDVTAMPFGLDTPSTIGMAVLVLGPAYARHRAAGLDPHAAALCTWYVGMAATFAMGAIKLPLSLLGRTLQRRVPQAGLLGSLAGIALLLIGFLPVLELMREPVVGFVTLGLVLYALVAKAPIPGRLPGVLFAVIAGTVLHYGLVAIGAVAAPATAVSAGFGVVLPRPDAHLLEGLREVPALLPLLVPFALLTVVGGINNTESARVAGDEYDVRDVLLGEAAATLLAGLAGGVAQTTPYVGHPAYKQMGARATYPLLTGVAIALCGCTGLLARVVDAVPLAALAPVLVFVALDVTTHAFATVASRHAPAVAICFFPAIARMLTIELGNPAYVPSDRFDALIAHADRGLPALAVIVALGNGFIITATLWGAFVTEMTEGRLTRAAAYLAAGAGASAFGIIHSVRTDGSLYLPWQLTGTAREVASQFCFAYLGLAATIAILGWWRRARPTA